MNPSKEVPPRLHSCVTPELHTLDKDPKEDGRARTVPTIVQSKGGRERVFFFFLISKDKYIE